MLVLPVTVTVVSGNRANLAGNAQPYHWIWGQRSTTYSGDTANGATAPFTRARSPPPARSSSRSRFWVP